MGASFKKTSYGKGGFCASNPRKSFNRQVLRFRAVCASCINALAGGFAPMRADCATRGCATSIRGIERSAETIVPLLPGLATWTLLRCLQRSLCRSAEIYWWVPAYHRRRLPVVGVHRNRQTATDDMATSVTYLQLPAKSSTLLC